MEPSDLARIEHLDKVWTHWARTTPDHHALLGLDRSPLSFVQLDQQWQRHRETLRRQGLGRMARLALLVPNGPELAAAFLVSATSAICAPLNPAYRQEELAFYLEDLQASALLIASTLDSPAREVARVLGIPILELHPEPEQPAGCFSITGDTGLPAAAEQMASPDDIALILHTSGTTAKPKQVPLTHANLCASIRHLKETLALTSQDRCLNLMPLFHIHGLVGALLAALGNGGSVFCPPEFSASDFFKWLHLSQPTWYTAVPTIHQAILAQAHLAGPVPLHESLRFLRSSSAPLSPRVMTELEQLFGVPVIEAYGMTEAAHQMASNPLPPATRKPGSVGLPAGPDIAVLSEHDQFLPLGAVGEIVIKGPNVMGGYRHNPEANARAFIDGWFRTGDQGYLDQDGYLFLTGRLKELINRGGEKISPLEIDQALLKHPLVQQAVTFAQPHPTLGEEVAAAVVLHQQAILKESELRQWLGNRMATHKAPKKILFLDNIPKGPTGKIQRRIIAEQFRSVLASETDTGADPLHALLMPIFQKVLKVEPMDADTNFFMVGGDSLQAIQIANRVQQMVPVQIDAVTIFEHPSVRELSQYLAGNTESEGVS